MPIVLSCKEACQDALDVVHQTLSRRAAGGFKLPKLFRADSATLSIAVPHRVEGLGMEDIRGAPRREKKKDAECWRFLVCAKEATHDKVEDESTAFKAVAAAIAVKSRTGRFEFGGINAGPFVEGTEKAIRRAEALEEVAKGKFEAVLVVVPALYVVALWLQDRSNDASKVGGKGDLLIPLASSNPAHKPFEPIKLADFLKALHRPGRSLPIIGSRIPAHPRRVLTSVPLS
jgi:hypothetical protein